MHFYTSEVKLTGWDRFLDILEVKTADYFLFLFLHIDIFRHMNYSVSVYF